MTKVLDDDLFDLIAEGLMHIVEKIKSGVAPLGGDGRYICLMYNEWIVAREFSCTSAVMSTIEHISDSRK